jgi:capsular exopolysaccharide synthesis family protein
VTQANFEQETEKDSGYGELFATFWRRRYLFFGVFAGVLSVSALIFLTKQPTYRSYTRFLIEPSYWDKQQENQPSDTRRNIDYATQLNLMKSRKLINQTVNQLSTEYPSLTIKEFVEKYEIDQIINEEKKQEVDTNIFQAVYTDNDPKKTKQVLETIQSVYQQYNREQQETRLNEGLRFINKQLPVARQSLIEADAALKRFRQENNLIAPEQEASVVAEELRELEKERETVEIKYEETKTLKDRLQKQLNRSLQGATISSRLSESSRYQALLGELQKTELKLSNERVKFTETNPVIENLIEERESQKKLLEQEVEKILGKVPVGLKLKGDSLEKEGQLGASDVFLSNELIKAQNASFVLQERDLGLARTEQKLRQRLNNFPTLIDKYNNLQQEVEVKRGSLRQLLEARQKLGIELNRGGFNWQVIEAPQVGEQMPSGKLKGLLLSGVLALFFGSAAVLIREELDNSVRSSDQIRGQLALPILGEVPQLPQSKLTQSQINHFAVRLPWRALTKYKPSVLQLLEWQPFRESLDLIYMNMQLGYASSPLRSLVITSAIPDEGKSTLSIGLAFSAARLHKRVLLIDTDLRRPTLHEKLNLPNLRGLSNLLTSNVKVPNIHKVSILGSNIDVLTSGPIPLDPISLLSGQKLKQLITKLEETYDLVLLDTPPTIGLVDAIQTASCCSGSLMIVRIDRVTKTQLAEATSLLSKLNLVGIIANGDKDNTTKDMLVEGGRYSNSLPTANS